MDFIKKVVLIFILITLIGCATVGRNFRWEDASEVRIGMTKEEVLEIMGKPSGVHETGAYELWTWVFVISSFPGNYKSKSFAVKFQEGIVVYTSWQDYSPKN